ncbi:MAG TPA: YggS family pyridoxal phosphate-dependent enzyme [Pyrinomonadaceae bacterium]|nr:YggS family pyridoxal phosphate-dependent enzyme [Pyrinomonadaceae bacterium]
MPETVSSAEALRARLMEVRRRIERAAVRSRRALQEVTLIGVSKTQPAEMVQLALAANLRDFGENRVQEADAKIDEIGHSTARWHLIGHLQANKARRAVMLFDLIHSLDSIALAERLDRLCAEEGRAELPVLIQVDLAGEETKSGASEEELPELAAAVEGCEHLSLRGLMVLPPFFEEAERVRPFFRRLRELRDALASRQAFGARRGELSMGMSHDFEIAIEEGATLVRVGTAIFGERLMRG